MRWFIEMFGGLRVRDAEQEITRFRTHKTAGLLAYLAFHLDRAHSREVLCELFWPEDDLDQARNSLSASLSSLRRQLEPPGVTRGSVLQAGRLAVHLLPAAVETDVARFDHLLTRAGGGTSEPADLPRLVEALSLYRGALLPGHYDDWILPEQERLAGQHAAAALLAAGLLRGERLPEAIPLLRQAVAAAPYREDLHRELLRSLAACGDLPGAGRHFLELRERLRRELDVDPEAATGALMDQLGLTPSTATPTGRAPVVAAAPQAVAIHPSPRPHLPARLTRFFGRATELSHLLEVIAAPGSPLVTLSGPGGCGKTRLAVEAAYARCEALAGRVCFVALGDLRDAALIPGAVVRALDLTPTSGDSLLNQAGAHLAQAPALLVLDNFEHLVEDGAGIVLALLGLAPDLRCLITSRRRLGLPGEREITLRPLPFPAGGESLEALARIPSVQLFIDRAQSGAPDFQITARTAPQVAAVCRALEGLPLALELVASWAGSIPPAQMLARWAEQGIAAKRRRPEDDPRRVSLSATMDWSYDLLPESLRRLWRRLSVFRGGWTVAAAAAVCDEPAPAHALLELRAHSLIALQEADPRAPLVARYRMLETVREYASGLLAAEERAETVLRHRAYYGELAAIEGARLQGSGQVEALAVLECEHSNLRSLLDQAIDRSERTCVTLSLWRFWLIRGHAAEGRVRLGELLEEPDGPPEGTVLCAAAALAEAQGDYAGARPLYEAARRLPDPAVQAEAIHGLAGVAEAASDFAGARLLLIDAVERRRALPDGADLATSLSLLGLVEKTLGRLSDARACFEESLALRRRLGGPRAIAATLGNLALLELDLRNDATALALLDEAGSLFLEAGDRRFLAATHTNKAIALARLGRLDQAGASYQAALDLKREVGDQWGVGVALHGLARVAMERRDLGTARARFAESSALLRSLGDRSGPVEALLALAGMAATERRDAQAVALAAAACAERDRQAAPLTASERQDLDAWLTVARQRLGDASYHQAWQRGTGLDLDAALSDAAAPSGL